MYAETPGHVTLPVYTRTQFGKIIDIFWPLRTENATPERFWEAFDFHVSYHMARSGCDYEHARMRVAGMMLPSPVLVAESLRRLNDATPAGG